MIPEFGHLALILALCLAAAQAFFGILGAQRNDLLWMSAVRPTAVVQALFTLFAFACLAYAFLVSDFSVAYVAENSNVLLPWPYRFTAVWGAHEGSLLLWVTVLGIWTLAVARFSRHLPLEFTSRVLGVMGVISLGFFLFMLTTSDPFTRLLPPVGQGRDLNPILQDPAMAIHPPMLYTGYVGFSVAFAFAVAALLGGRMDSVWARWARPWTLTAWLFLSFGITLGSWWSYYELGWGGWWFWDPVENASFMPWLVGTALVHSLAVTEKRGAFKSWTVLLAIAAFSLSLLGTFLVRSGVLISVHSFASDPKRGIFILAMLGLFVGAALTLYAWRAPSLTRGGGFQPFSRETLLLLNNIFLVVAAASVLLGTLYPLMMDALNLGRLSVGPPYFNSVFVPVMLPFLVLIGIGPYVRWKHGDPKATARTVKIAALLALLAGVIAVIVAGAERGLLLTAGVMLATWAAASAFVEPVRRLRLRLQGRHSALPRSVLGMSLAHLGAGCLVLGITVTSLLGVEQDQVIAPGGSATVAGYRFDFQGVTTVDGPNYQADQGRFVVSRDGEPITTMLPEKRRFSSTETTEAAIHPGLTRDLYLALGNSLDNGSWSVRIEYKPLVRFIWLGGILMMLGGILAASDRRYRQRRTEAVLDASAAASETGGGAKAAPHRES
ncbi:MAG TPA: heme lyase CcmF/NrfE family subunit [Gammaproteobacteria bacterium]|jgi:cytochrome c-type biogenesis protein CcmF|nr:heme lyase CcmF/NrfE family subunit [Gammaproteobacteria bacterium]